MTVSTSILSFSSRIPQKLVRYASTLAVGRSGKAEAVTTGSLYLTTSPHGKLQDRYYRRPWMTPSNSIMIAMTRRIWMNPPMV
jgi:hypothetical protein